jgi:CzcA family heavy metal efflux pump
MLNAVIRASLRYRGLVMLIALAILVYGSYAATTLPIDVFPDLDRPRVVVMTEAPGLAPEEVETLVTFPLESALLGASNVQAVRSQSGIGLSVVNVEFDWGTDIRLARQIVQERLSSIQGTLPEGLRPQPGPISSIMGQIMNVGLQRLRGPGDGEVIAIPKTPLIAELTHDPVTGKAALSIWDPKGSRNPAMWKPGPTPQGPIALSWKEPEAPRDTTVTLTDAADRALVRLGDRVPFEALDRRVQATIAGQMTTLDFPSTLRQQIELRTTADWVLRPRLLKIAGIAQVTIVGGGRKQYQVLVNPTALAAFDVTLQHVEKALRDNNLSASGGFAIRGDKEQPIRILGRLGARPEQVINELLMIPVKTTPQRNVLLSQVARVVEGAQVKRGDASVNGSPGVVLTITKQPHNDTRRLTNQIVAALKEIEATLPIDIAINSDLFQLKGFIDRGLYNVTEALVLGAGLVIIVLFIFLLNLRTTFISLTAIPLSLAITVIVFKMVGWFTGAPLSINVMTLGGIAVALGELVDDAIVDVENIFRRLRENHALAKPIPALTVIYEASAEIRSAIVFGTIMVILVFLPLFALSGVEGRLFAPLGVAYIVSILASLLVSLTFTPVLSYYLLPQSKATHSDKDSPLLRVMKWGAEKLIRFSMRRANWILLATWVLVAVSAWTLTRLGADFLPAFDEGSIQLNLTLPPGSPLEASNEMMAVVDAKLRTLRVSPTNPKGVLLDFFRRSGRAELDEHVDPVSQSECILRINPDSGLDREEVIELIQKEARAAAPGVDIEVEQPLAHLISHMLSGVTAQIAIKIQGDDLETLGQVAHKIKNAIDDVPGISPPVIEPQKLIDELHIRFRPEQLAIYGVSRAYVAEFLTVALKGEEVSQVLEGQRRFDLVVRLDEPYRTDYSNLGRLRVELPNGKGQVALAELATIGDGLGANQVNRENARRRMVIRVNAQGRDLASIVGDIKARVDRVVRPDLPAGYFIEYGGQFESQSRATTLITALALAALVGMFVILYRLYPSTRITLQILNALPTAFIGGVLALVLTRQTLTVASMVGFISLGGIAARNGILLVTHYFHLMRHEGERFSQEMILRGSLERLAPVLMTALTAGIGLVPLVIEGGEPGREILYPVATVILGGLVTSTLCEFLLHPGLFWKYSGKDALRLTEEVADD